MKRVILVSVILKLTTLLTVSFLVSSVFAEQLPYLEVDQEVDDIDWIEPWSSSPFPGRKFSQSFVPTQNNLAAVQHSLLSGRCGNNDEPVVEIRADSGGFPDSTVIGFSDSTEKGFVQTSTFDPPVSLTPGETYHMVHYIFQGTCSNDTSVPVSVTSGDGYPMGQAYSLDESGNWQVGAPRGSSGDLVETDFIIKTFYTGFHEAPIAIISDEFKIAWANETVTLDGSSSNDPDGTIVRYKWISLPSERTIGDGVDPIVEYKAQGYAQEVIQLRVTDDKGAVATDTIDIWHPLVLK